MSKNTTTELDFEDLLQEIGENSSKATIGDFEFTELTMQDQRKILNMGFNPIEIPVRLSNMYNEYIKTSVVAKDDIANISRIITIDIKPFVVVALRQVTLGDKYIDSDTNIKYTLRKVDDKDFEKKIEPASIKFNDFTIYLEVPTLEKDTSLNNLLLGELSKFKSNNMRDEDYGKVADIYQMYEIMKYITEIEINGGVFDFAKSAVNKKMKIINSLPQRVVVEINEYIESVRNNEGIALTMTNDETSEESKISMDALFYSRFARDRS